MEKLNHAHPPPNCPACEEVGRLQAEDINRRKLEVAEKMVASLRYFHREGSPLSHLLPNHAAHCDNCQFCELLSAWNKAGKGS